MKSSQYNVFAVQIHYRHQGQEYSFEVYDESKKKAYDMMEKARIALRAMGIKKFIPGRHKVELRPQRSHYPTIWSHLVQEQDEAVA